MGYATFPGLPQLVKSTVETGSQGWARWLMPVIPALWEAKQEDHLRPGAQDQPDQHGETPYLLKTQN